MMLGARMAAWAKSGYTAKDYVQDGLVAMWDGIENVGYGEHSNSATAWKDLIGSANLTANGTPVWGDDKCAFNGNFSMRGSSSSIVTTMQGDCTFELLIKPTGYKGNGGVYDFGGTSHDSWAFSWPREGAVNWYNAMTFQKAEIPAVRSSFSPVPENWTNHLVSLTSNNGTIGEYIDGVYLGQVSAGSPTSTSSSFAFGYIFNFNSGIFDMHRANIYSRALTASEIAANYAVDAARFNLT